jgi:hypothetical protein
MFFNESSLYLEGDEMSDAEIQDSAANEDPEVSEAYCLNAYAEGLEWQIGADEYYYNMREKMMNIEHVAALKEARGLYSEAETLLSEGAGEFVDRVKNFFINLGKLIEETFAKFVNFISSLFVSNKTVINANADAAWDRWNQIKHGTQKVKVKIYNISPKEAQVYPSLANTILNDLKTEVNKIKGNALNGNNIDFPKTLKARYNEKRDAKMTYLFGEMRTEHDVVLQKQSKDLTKEIFTEAIAYAKVYKQHITKVKKSKELAKGVVKDAIKFLNNVKSTGTSGESNYKFSKTQRENVGNSKAISAIKWAGSKTNAVFNKLISIMSNYYRQCIAIGKRVIGANNASDKAQKIKAMTEGFDFGAYFDYEY